MTPPDRAPVETAPHRRALARSCLCGELDDQVQLPVHTVCAALGVDPDALAQAVRRRSAVPALPDVRPRRAS